MRGDAIGPVMVIAGEEPFLRHQALSLIQRQVLGEGDPGMALVRLTPPIDIATVLDECRTLSMFSPAKLVILEDADAWLKAQAATRHGRSEASHREILEHYLENPAESAVLVLIAPAWLKTTRLHKQLDAKGWVRVCEPMKLGAAPSWVARRAREAHGKGIEPNAVSRLVDLVGPDLMVLDNELGKLALYEPQKPTITLAAVDALVGFQHERPVWELVGALSESNAAMALQRLDELWQMDGKTMEYSAVGALFTWVNQLLKARELLALGHSDGEILREVKIWPEERARKTLALARRGGLAGALRWSGSLRQVDKANKSGLGEVRRNLEKFIVGFCASHPTK